MGNESKKNKNLQKTERKLKRARDRFEAIREQYLLVREHGKQQVERAQLEAERRLTKANERLEKRAHALHRAEARLLELAPEQATSSASVSTDGVSSPEAAAAAIEHVQTQRGIESSSPILHGE